MAQDQIASIDGGEFLPLCNDDATGVVESEVG